MRKEARGYGLLQRLSFGMCICEDEVSDRKVAIKSRSVKQETILLVSSGAYLLVWIEGENRMGGDGLSDWMRFGIHSNYQAHTSAKAPPIIIKYQS